MQPFPVEYLFAISEQLLFLVPYLLAVMPLMDMRGMTARQIIIGACVVVALSVLLGCLCARIGLPGNHVDIPVAIACVIAYKHFAKFDWARTIFICASAFVVSVYIASWAVLVDAIVVGDTLSSVFLAWPGMEVQWGLSILFVLLLQWPARHLLPHLLESRAASSEKRSFWNIAWISPTVVCVTLLYIRPQQTLTLLFARVGEAYGVILVALFVIIVLFYVIVANLMYSADKNIVEIERIRRRSVQTMFIEHLDDHIAAARRANHDNRQFIQVLNDFAKRDDLEGFREYAGKLLEEAPDTEALVYCENTAVNIVVLYYCDLARQIGINPDIRINVPANISYPSADLTALFGNLMENALDELSRSIKSGADPKQLKLRMRTTYSSFLPFVITIDNTCLDNPIFLDDGSIMSSKRDAVGIGTESVRAIAEKHGGIARFECDEGVFRASVMLASPRNS